MPLGLNLGGVQSVLRSFFNPERIAGSAFVKRPGSLAFFEPSKEPIAVFAFVRQTLRQERGRWTEKSTALRMFHICGDGQLHELDSRQRADLIRACQSVPRVKDANGYSFRHDLQELELTLYRRLRRPTDEEIAEGIRYSVWPIAMLILVP
jgi:hypothetical protein